MVYYECPRCHYGSNNKNTLWKHYNRKNVCKTLFQNKSIVDCKFELNESRLIIEELMEKNKELEGRILNLENMNGGSQIGGDQNNINTLNNNCHNNYTINNTIVVNAYKETDYSMLEDVIEDCFRKINGEEQLDLGKCIRYVHCNKDYPKNHNIYIADASRKKLMVFDGEKFNNRGEGRPGIERFFNNFRSSIKKYIKKDLLYDLSKEYSDPETHESRKKEIRDAISTELLNGREMVERTHRNEDDLLADDELA